MKCSKGRFAFYPILETLEDRLQPGSVILGQEFGWLGSEPCSDMSAVFDPVVGSKELSSDCCSMRTRCMLEITRSFLFSLTSSVHSTL